MPTPTYDLIASNVLGSSASSVTFSSISGSYRDLVLVVNATAGGNNLTLRFNSDSGSNYNIVWANGNGSTAVSNSESSQTQMRLTTASYITSVRNTNISQIMDYSATNKHKTVLARGNGEFGVDMIAGRWASTSAITSVQAICDGGNFDSGSTFYLYGIVS